MKEKNANISEMGKQMDDFNSIMKSLNIKNLKVKKIINIFNIFRWINRHRLNLIEKPTIQIKVQKGFNY
jgi:hypothetical protein